MPLTHVSPGYRCPGEYTLDEPNRPAVAGEALGAAALGAVMQLRTGGGVDFREFCTRLSTFVLVVPPHEDRDQVKFWFDAFDVDGNGTIGIDEFEAILAYLCFNEVRKLKVTARAFFDIVDTNGDNQIELAEFISMVRRFHSLQKYVRSSGGSGGLWGDKAEGGAGAAEPASKPTGGGGCCSIM